MKDSKENVHEKWGQIYKFGDIMSRTSISLDEYDVIENPSWDDLKKISPHLDQETIDKLIVVEGMIIFNKNTQELIGYDKKWEILKKYE